MSAQPCRHQHHVHAPGPCSAPPPCSRVLSRRGFATGLLASAAAASLAACATSPVTGRSSFGSIERDAQIGRQEHPKILQAFGGEYGGPVAGYVRDVGNRVAQRTEYPGLAYRFTVLDSPIVNAFALPGGYVYLTRGLLALASNEAEVAGVLGHEIGHVTARHSAERQTQSIAAQLGLILLGVATESPQLVDAAAVGAQLFLQSYSREQEMEADTLGIRYMADSGYDPQAMVTFLGSLREQSQLEAAMAGADPSVVDEYNMMATHPRTVDRVQEAMTAAGARGQGGELEREDHLQAIDGMLYGDNPNQGVIDGRWFRHPELRFAFRAPAGFQLFNSTQEVTAQHRNGAGFVFDMATTRSGNPREYLVREWAGRTPLDNVETFQVNGLAGATGSTLAQTRSGAVALRPTVLQGDGNSVYRFLFVAPANQADRWTPAFRETLDSFRRLSAAEAQQVRGFYLDIVTVRGGDSVASLARGMPFGRFNEQAFRVLNDLTGGGQPAAGQQVKVVRAG